MNLDLSFMYWVDVFCALQVFLSILAFLVGTFALITEAFSIYYQTDHYEKDERKASNMKKSATKFFVGTIILAVIAIFLPSKDFMYAVGIAKNIENNSEVISSTVTSTVDYIIEAIDELEDGNDTD